jgi:hypothetical protein
LRDIRVRLACVRHAASVDSEPGSNSHVKFVGRSCERRNSLTRGRFIGSALFNPFVICRGFPPVAFARTDNSGRPIPRLHALTLIVFLQTLALPLALKVDGLCVLARTIQFSKNRPTGRPGDARIPCFSTVGWPADRVWGNLLRLLEVRKFCQPQEPNNRPFVRISLLLPVS